jgi:hypothetical protein
MKKSSEEIANKILEGLDNAEKASTPPFLHTRVLQSIRHEQALKTEPNLVWKWAFTICLLAFLGFNIIAVKQYFNKGININDTNIDAIVSEYEIGENNMINL